MDSYTFSVGSFSVDVVARSLHHADILFSDIFDQLPAVVHDLEKKSDPKRVVLGEELLLQGMMYNSGIEEAYEDVFTPLQTGLGCSAEYVYFNDRGTVYLARRGIGTPYCHS